MVIQRYERALESLPSPPYMVFEYNVDQAGWHDLTQTHRIYRTHEVRRDELIAEDGRPVKPPEVYIRRGVRDRYALMNVAPQPAGYAFSFAGIAHVGNHLAYAFTTTPLGRAHAFAVRRVVIDGLSYLPITIAFETHGPGASGVGTMQYAKSGRYWVPTRVSLSATVEGKKATESIAFSAYSFPKTLPPTTFKTGRVRVRFNRSE